MEEEKTKTKTKTTRSKKQVSNRLLDVMDRIEIEAQKQNSELVNKTTSNNNNKGKNSKKQSSTTKSNDKAKKETKKNVKTTRNHDKLEDNKNEKNKKEELQLIKREELKQIEEVIESEKKVPKEKMQKINQKVFENILIAIVIMLYLIFINLGYININEQVFLTDLQVFSITLIILTILIFEQAYKKDSGKLTINGIEVLVLSIISMLLPKLYKDYSNFFMLIVATISFLFGIYYVGKSIIIYVKMKRKIVKNSLKKIVKK